MNMSLVVAASGMVTPLGYSAPATLAALRAGISGVRAQAWADRAGNPYRVARVSLPQRWSGVELLADLLAPAIDECVRAARDEALRAMPLLIGVSHSSRPHRPENLEQRLLAVLSERMDSPLHPASRLYPSGQTGCAAALLDAQRLMAEERAHQVIVAGADSYIDRQTLRAYEDRRRLLAGDNCNGFLPGEAGCAVLLRATAVQPGDVCVTGWAAGVENAPIEDTLPLRGEALTEVMRNALQAAGLRMQDISFRATDLSGEHYKFKEAMFAEMRLETGGRDQPLDMWHPIEYLGEIGAAIVPCLLAWVRHAMQNGYAPGMNALCHVGNDPGERAAFVVRCATPPGGLTQ